MEIKKITLDKEDIENMDQEDFEKALLEVLGLPEDTVIHTADLGEDDEEKNPEEGGLTLIRAQVVAIDEGINVSVGSSAITRDIFWNIDGFPELYQEYAMRLTEVVNDFARGLLDLVGAETEGKEEEE